MRAKPPGGLRLIATNRPANLRPSAISGLTSLTPAQNSYPAATEVIAAASITEEIWAVSVIFMDFDTNAVARDGIATVYLGGEIWLPHLLMSQAAGSSGTNWVGAVQYEMVPIGGRSGRAVSAAVSVNSATLTAGRVIIDLYGRPSGGPVWRGTKMTAYGIDTANSRGTLCTSGTTSDGAWVELLGTLSEEHHWWEYGFGWNNAVTSGAQFIDTAIGDATNKRLIHEDVHTYANTVESIGKRPAGRWAHGAPGQKVYGRIQSSASASSDMSLAMYGVC